jgi:hypothetical protein
MNKNILFFYLLITFANLCFSQIVEFGVGFTPYDVSSSTQEVKFEKDNAVEKIMNYFYGQQSSTENFVVSSSTDSNVELSSNTITVEQLKRLFYGFGRTEIIQLLLINQKCPEVSIKTLVEERRKNKPLKELAKRYNLDYINEIWLPSKKIYKEIFIKQ